MKIYKCYEGLIIEYILHNYPLQFNFTIIISNLRYLLSSNYIKNSVSTEKGSIDHK